MSFTSLQFLAFVVLTALITQAAGPRLRLGCFLVASAVFTATYVPNLLALAPLLAFVLAGYMAILLAGSGRVRHAALPGLAILVLTFIWLKRYPFVTAVPPLPFPYVLVGLSYILFRLLHVLLDVGDGVLAPPPFWRYVGYLFFLPSFLSGPINRYEPFDRQLDEPVRMDNEAAYATLWRFVIGFAKVAVFGECLHLLQGLFAGRLESAVAGHGSVGTTALLYAASAVLYMLFLFANFSGYTDMAISIGRLFGIVLPENFNRPFMASNFQDFWSRWHITLSDWFKIYFFNPLLKSAMRRWPDPRLAPYLGVAALFVVFLVLGAWHGASWEYLLCGALLGAGVAVNKLYQIQITRWLGKRGYQAIAKRPIYIWSARGLTLAWVALALTPFWKPVDAIAALIQRLDPLGLFAAIAIMSLVFAVGVLAIHSVLQRSQQALTPAAASVGMAGRTVILASAIFAIAVAVPLINSSTDFVYKAF